MLVEIIKRNGRVTSPEKLLLFVAACSSTWASPVSKSTLLVAVPDFGIGLLPLLKSIHKPCNLKAFAGRTIGVDAYGWLHRGTVSCAIDLALDKPTTKFAHMTLRTLYRAYKPLDMLTLP